MQNFDFHNPTRIVFGKDRIADLGTLVPADAKVLILVGGSSAEKTGTLAEVRQALGARQHATFSGIEPNPSYETSMQAVQQVKDGNFDFLLAVGGGSVIDAVKFIAAAALYSAALAHPVSADEFRTPAISIVKPDWPAAVNQLKAEIEIMRHLLTEVTEEVVEN